MNKKNEMRNLKVAKAIEAFGKSHDLLGDTCIYFNGIRWNYSTCHGGKRKEETDMKASDYFDYANDESVCMSFEGGFYDALNMHYGCATHDAFLKILNEKFNAYFELGNAWNLTVVFGEVC
jgi:hypothetical protein